MPVYFNNVSGISLDHTVEKHVFDVIILMMVHDGFHDFYNDKSKDDFIDLFKKYSVATTVAGGGSTNMEGGSSGVDDIQNLFNVGDRVFHEKFGYGIITELEADKALVDFEKADRKNIKTAFLTSEKDL